LTRSNSSKTATEHCSTIVVLLLCAFCQCVILHHWPSSLVDHRFSGDVHHQRVLGEEEKQQTRVGACSLARSPLFKGASTVQAAPRVCALGWLRRWLMSTVCVRTHVRRDVASCQARAKSRHACHFFGSIVTHRVWIHILPSRFHEHAAAAFLRVHVNLAFWASCEEPSPAGHGLL
jgi:hypothetical protein